MIYKGEYREGIDAPIVEYILSKRGIPKEEVDNFEQIFSTSTTLPGSPGEFFLNFSFI